eukprot:5408261-Amphidinium_carterae.1
MQPYEQVLDILQEPADDETVHFMSHEWLARCGMSLVGDVHVDLYPRASAAQESDLHAFLKGVSAGTSATMKKMEGYASGMMRVSMPRQYIFVSVV